MTLPADAPRIEVPAIVPAGWRLVYLTGWPAFVRDFPNGLRALFTLDVFPVDTEDAPLGTAGRYRHMSISRPRRYPGWDEMRDLRYDSGLFDNERDAFMVLPPKRRYTNVHPYTFHFYQAVTS